MFIVVYTHLSVARMLFYVDCGWMQGLDVVPSDIAAGLILIQRQQQMRAVRLDFESSSVHHSAVPQQHVDAADGGPSSPSLPSWMTLDNAAHFMKFAGASYGWPFFMLGNLLCGPCKLCCSCRYGCLL